MTTQTNLPVLELRKVCMTFGRLPVFADINISLREGEILGLLGRSGSGKSTLVRICAGLVRPTSGEVLYRGNPFTGPAEGIAVVFQTFALFPWLTVIENVEIGLDALGLSRDEAHSRAMSAIDLIGLDGFQSAYPRELSGGMRQRVGFARALVIKPTVLLMDEPFSALDVLIAENLRTDFLDLWAEHELPTKSVMLVTHNIEEAVLMCDRILVLSTNPGQISAEICVPLDHPRIRMDSEFQNIVDEIYSIMTLRTIESIKAGSPIHGGLAQPLPEVGLNLISGFIEELASQTYGGCAELAAIARSLPHLGKYLLELAEALHILEFADVKDGTIKLNAAGNAFARSETEERKRLFKEHLLRFVPLAAHIRHILDERAGHIAPRVRFESEIEDHLNPGDADKTLRAVTDWGRYAEVFSYDDETQTFSVVLSGG